MIPSFNLPKDHTVENEHIRLPCRLDWAICLVLPVQNPRMPLSAHSELELDPASGVAQPQRGGRKASD